MDFTTAEAVRVSKWALSHVELLPKNEWGQHLFIHAKATVARLTPR